MLGCCWVRLGQAQFLSHHTGENLHPDVFPVSCCSERPARRAPSLRRLVKVTDQARPDSLLPVRPGNLCHILYGPSHCPTDSQDPRSAASNCVRLLLLLLLLFTSEDRTASHLNCSFVGSAGQPQIKTIHLLFRSCGLGC